MAKPMEWTGVLGNKTRHFRYERTWRTGKLWIDGECYPTNEKPVTFNEIDATLEVHGKTVRMVKGLGRETDFIVDGVFAGSGKPFVKMPGWTFVFLLVCFTMMTAGYNILDMIVAAITGEWATILQKALMGGLSAGLGVLAIAGCIGAVKSHRLVRWRFWICLGITVLLWCVCILVALGIVAH